MAGELSFDARTPATTEQIAALQAALGAVNLPAGVAVGPLATDLLTERGGFNLKASLIPRLATAVAQCEIGIAPSRYLVGFIGDSTTAGTRGANDVKTTGYPSRLVPLLQQSGGVFDENSFWGSNGVTPIAGMATYDPRITIGAGIIYGTEPSVGGFGYAMAAATAPLVFAPDKPFNSFDFNLIAGSTGGTVGVQIDSGPVVNIVGPVSTLQKTTITTTDGGTTPITLGTHTIKVTQVSGAQIVQAISCRDTTTPKIMIGNMGRAGWTSTNWITVNPTGPNRSPMNALYQQLPLAVFINLGINDWSLAIPVATFKANIQTLIDLYKPQTDVILMVPFPSLLSAYPAQGDYVAALYDLARTNNLPLIDLGIIMTSQEVADALGRYVDSRHPSPTGYQVTAQFLNRVIRRLLRG